MGAAVKDLYMVRPARPGDLDDLLRLAAALGSGVTTLPPDRGLLAGRIEDSVSSFGRHVRNAGGGWYLLVLVHPDGHVCGTSAVVARVGGFDPYYTYEVRPEVHHHDPLGVHREVRVMHLVKEHKGPSELASLAVDPGLRTQGLGRLLSLSRLLLISAHRERFDDRIIVELRGYQDEAGRSPFWDSVGAHFFNSEFAEADFLSGLGNKDFIEDLMPRHPIYLDLLPERVRAAVGRPHEHSAPAMRMLEREGMVHRGAVDIFDAGPILSARVDELTTVRMHRRMRVAALGEPDRSGPRALVANGRLDFRATFCHVQLWGDDQVRLPVDAAHLLEVGIGDMVQVHDV
ncbi:MAG: arginine N-succinyltransferase [Thermoleophilia bacterium]